MGKTSSRRPAPAAQPVGKQLEQGRVVQIYKQLKPRHRDSWVRHGNELIEEHSETSTAKPFIRA